MPMGSLQATHRDMHWADGDVLELYDWMTGHLPAGAIVLASMPLSAQLRLNTPLRVAIHPQFEKQSLRDRVQEIYQFYQCTPPEKFVAVMRKYRASFFVIEYKRCDFSPFILDWYPELNCKKGERPWEDLFCPRLHATKHFKMLFVNAGYGVFRLRNASVAPSQKKSSIKKMGAWRPMLEQCLEAEEKYGEVCVARITEVGQMFHEKLKQPQVAEILLGWAKEHGADNGLVQYTIGRHLDYDHGRQDEAAKYYRQAYELLPNNPLIVREYLMWLDVERKDNRSLEALMRPRRWTKGSRLSLVDLADAVLACEASVAAFELFRDLDWSEELWRIATQYGIGSDCVKNNWPLNHGGNDLSSVLGKWGLFLNIFWYQGLKSHLVSVSSSAVRWQPPRRQWTIGLEGSF